MQNRISSDDNASKKGKREIRTGSSDVLRYSAINKMDSRIYPHSELHSAVYSATRKLTPDLVYQIAIVVAALLLVITASLF